MASTETAEATASEDGDGDPAVWPLAPARTPLVTPPAVELPPVADRAGRLERTLDRLPFVEKEMPVVARMVQPGWTCIDIGAAGGTYTHLLSRRVGPLGRVHAVEPRARSMRYLRRFRAWFGWDNVELHQLALADDEGHAELQVPRFARTEAHLLGRTNAVTRSLRSETVTMTTLDALVRSRGLESVELIKCDVEGAELSVLRGAEETLARFRPALVVEVEARHLARYDSEPDDVLAWLVARDYVPHRTRGGQLLPVDGILPDENDYVLLPRERMARP